MIEAQRCHRCCVQPHIHLRNALRVHRLPVATLDPLIAKVITAPRKAQCLHTILTAALCSIASDGSPQPARLRTLRARTRNFPRLIIAAEYPAKQHHYLICFTMEQATARKQHVMTKGGRARDPYMSVVLRWIYC